MPNWAKTAIDRWTAAATIDRGRLFRAIAQNGEVGREITPQTVYLIVKGHVQQLGLNAAPRDLRRTFAKLAHLGRSDVEQIQLSLGHHSILTTEGYLGIRQS